MLESEKIESVRAQLGELLSYLREDVSSIVTPGLGESFELHTLPFDALSDLSEPDSLLLYMRRTGAWLHLIRSADGPIAVAQSSAHGPTLSEWSVQNLFSSPLALKLAKAIEHLDSVRSEDAIEATLFLTPSLHIYAFLLLKQQTSEVYVIAVPEGVKSLREGEFYTNGRFVRLLGIDPARGRLTLGGQTFE